MSYFTSLLASALSKHATWCEQLAKKILRYLSGTRDSGLFLPNAGDESSLIAWSDVGYAGLNTKAQSGLFLSWAGAPLLWRSSRQTVSSLSTAEAELGAGALTWQITEGMRSLLEEWGITLEPIKLLMDNDAAVAITEQGP